MKFNEKKHGNYRVKVTMTFAGGRKSDRTEGPFKTPEAAQRHADKLNTKSWPFNVKCEAEVEQAEWRSTAYSPDCPCL